MPAITVGQASDTAQHSTTSALDRLLLDDLARQLAPPALPGRDDLAVVSGAFQAPRSVGQHETWDPNGLGRAVAEGRTFRLDVSLGVLQLRAFDGNRVERQLERDNGRARRDSSLLAAAVDDDGTLPVFDARGREVTEWSWKSRRRMVQTYAALDYAPLVQATGTLAMVTLTYPNDWLAVAPTGRDAKRHLDRFRKRWSRAMGAPIVGLWKQEFQRPRRFGPSAGQRAPHFHLLLSVPVFVDGEPFREWLARTWVACVNPKDPAERERMLAVHRHQDVVDFGRTSTLTDHKRIAVYFLKHGAKTLDDKEYQHIVPEAWRSAGAGPGRFWGYWGLDKPVQHVDLDVADYFVARRVLRAVRTANARSIAYRAARARAEQDGAAPAESVRAGCAARYRRPRSFGVGGNLSGGWVLANDGIAVSLDLARYLSSLRS